MGGKLEQSTAMQLDVPKMLDSVVKLIAVSGTICLLLSILFDWGFFYELNLSLMVAPTTLVDHARSSLLWAPVVLPFVFSYASVLGLAFSLTRKLAARGPMFDQSINLGLRIFNIGIVCAAFGAWILFGDKFKMGLWVLVVSIWFMVVRRLFPLPMNVSEDAVRRRSRFRMFVFLLPCFLLFVFFMGTIAAHARIEKPLRSGYAVLKNQPDGLSGPVFVIRSLEKFSIVSDHSRRVALVKVEDLVRVELIPGHNSPFRGLVCEWFNTCID